MVECSVCEYTINSMLSAYSVCTNSSHGHKRSVCSGPCDGGRKNVLMVNVLLNHQNDKKVSHML